MDRAKASASQLLTYLDFLRPLLLQDRSLVKVALTRFEFLQGKVKPPDPPLTLGTYEMSKAEARKFFPTENPSFERLLDLLSVSNRILGPRVILLDLLTVLALVVRCSLEEKAQYLFEWYNVSKTGVLSEIEHIMLIMRISSCLHRMKIIGAVDVTEDDAKHIAMTSRVYRETEKNKGASINDFVGVEEDKDNFTDDINSHRSKHNLSKIRFLPGLRFEDFLRWCRTSKEASVLSRFAQVLDRLTDSLLVLDARTDSIANIVEQKRLHKEKSYYVPHPDSLPNMQPVESGSGEKGRGGLVKVVYRGPQQVVLTVAARVFGAPVAECYVKVEMVHTVPEPLYPVPLAVQRRNNNSPSYSAALALPSCCRRVYSRVSYQKCRLRYVPGFTLSSQLVQVTVTGLDSGARFVLTVYTPEVILPPVEAHTTLSRVDLSLSVPTTGDTAQSNASSRVEGKAQHHMTVGLLPASLSLEEALSFIKTTPSLCDATMNVVSSTLVNIAQELKQLTLFANTLQPAEGLVDGFAETFAVNAAVSADARYSAEFEHRCALLYGLASGNEAYIEGLTSAHAARQVVYFNGMGPWGSPDNRVQIKKHLQATRSLGGSKWALLDAVSRELEDIYARYASPLCPPVPSLEVGPLELLLVNDGGLSRASIASRVHALAVPDGDGLGDGQANKTTEGRGLSRLVLVLRSPADLLDPLHAWTKYVPIVQGPPPSPLPSLAKTEPARAPAPAGVAAEEGVEVAKQADGGVLVSMPSFGTVVDAPSERQLRDAKDRLDAEALAGAPGDSLEQRESRNDADSSAEQGQEVDESEESQALRRSYEANQWPHQKDGALDSNAAGDPGGDYYDASGADLRGVGVGVPASDWADLTPQQRLAGQVYFDKRSTGARTALELAESAHPAPVDSDGGGGWVALDGEAQDEGFRTLLDALVAWAGGAEGRSVLLVSCGWARGTNFELLLPLSPSSAAAGAEGRAKVRIVHENLLPTRGHSSIAPASSTDSHNTANATVEDGQVELEDDRLVDLLLGRMRTSLPEGASLTPLAASGLRALTLSADITFHRLGSRPDETSASQESKHGIPEGPGPGVAGEPVSMPVLATIVDVPDTAQRAQNQSVVSTPEPAPPFSARLTQEFVPWNRIVDKQLQAPGNTDLPPVHLVDGPRLLRVEHDKAVVGCVAVGYGRVKCTVYELPFELNYKEAVSLCVSERRTLRKVSAITKRCTKRREISFRFNDLRPYHNYCVSLDTWTVTAVDESAPSEDMPNVCQFRTLYNKHSKSCSMIVAGVSEADYALPSFSVSKIEELLNSTRPPAAPVHLLHVQSRHYARSRGPVKPSRTDLQKLSRHASVVHTLGEVEASQGSGSGSPSDPLLGDSLDREKRRADALWDEEQPPLDWALKFADTPSLQRGARVWGDSFHEYDSNFSPLNISWNGRFCRIAARDGSVRCLEKMVEMVERLHMWLPEVDNITLFVHKPLLRYLRKLRPREVPKSADAATYTDAGTFTAATAATTTATGATAAAAEMPARDERWEWDYPDFGHRASSEEDHAAVCAALFSVLIRWKAAGIGRDALVVCVAEVKKIQVATVGYCLRERRRLEKEREAEAEAAAQFPSMDIMSSSVAYSAAEDSSIVTADQSLDNLSAVVPEVETVSASADGAGAGAGAGAGHVEGTHPTDGGSAPGVAGGSGEGTAVEQSSSSTAEAEPAAPSVSVQGEDSLVEDGGRAGNTPTAGSAGEASPEAEAEAEAEAGAEAGAGAEAEAEVEAEAEAEAEAGAGAGSETLEEPAAVNHAASADTGEDRVESEAQGGVNSPVDEEATPDVEDGDDAGTDAGAAFSEGAVSSSAPATAVAGPEAYVDVDGDAFPPPPGSPIPHPKPNTAPAGMALSSGGSMGMGLGMGLLGAVGRSRDSNEGKDVPPETIPEEHDGEEEALSFQELHDQDIARSVLMEPEPEPEPEPLPEEHIRHIILPLCTAPEEKEGHAGSEEDHWAHVRDQIKFASGLQLLHGDIEYEFDRDPELADYNLMVQPRREYLYGTSIDLHRALDPARGTFEPAVYLFDVFIRPGEGANLSLDSPDMASFAGSVDIPSPSSLYTEYTARNQFHFLVLRSYVTELDLAAVVTGPVIGEVSQTTARVALELNHPLRQLTVLCRPLGRTKGAGVPVDEDGDYVNLLFDDVKKVHHEYIDGGAQPDVEWVQKDVKPFKVFHMHFEGLIPGQPYGIYIPELFGVERQGFFRTFKEWTRESEAVFLGQNVLAGLPVVNNILTQMKVHQIADLRHLVREMQYLFGSKIAALYSTAGEITRYAEIIGGSYPTKPWSYAAEHIQRPCTESVITFHLGSLSLLSHFLDSLVVMLIEHARKAHFPISEASCAGAYYFNEFEEVIKDSFRVAWSVPAIQEQLRSGANVPMFLSEYLLSFSSVPEELKNPDKGASEQDIKLLAIVRKVYENQLSTYMFPLYGHTGDGAPSHHGRVYRTGPLAYILLDIVSGRKKVKKKKAEAAEEEGDEGGKRRKTKKEDVSGRFSMGFLDKEQWRLIKSCAEDKMVTQMIILTQKPFLHLYQLGSKYDEPESVEKGEMLEWAPTTYDLRLFFTYFTEWLRPKEGEPMQSKTVALVSTDTIPYVTQVQDLPSGTKIQQLVLGDAGVDEEYVPANEAEAEAEWGEGGSSLAGAVPPLNLDAGALEAQAGAGAGAGAGERIMPEDVDAREARERQQMIVGGTTVVDMTPRSPRAPPSARLEGDLQAVRRLADHGNASSGGGGGGQAGPSGGEGDVKVDGEYQERDGEELDRSHQHTDTPDFGAPRMEDLTLTGKIGKFRYVHRFGELDYVHVDTSRESIVGGILDRNADLQKLRRGVFATLSFTFDSWKAVGLWRVLDHSENKLESPGEPALLLVGPILGPPGLVPKQSPDDPQLFEVGVLIEADRDTTVTFAVRNAMFGTTERYSYDVEAKRPTICKINDLEVDARYNVKIVGGVRPSHCQPFVISTALSWTDTNIAFVNCRFVEGEIPQEDFCKELLRRYKVPFNGINATVHLNSTPHNLRDCLQELKRLPILREGLARAWEIGHLTNELYEAMANAMELIRDVYRRHLARASYRELLRSGFNLFMHTHDIFQEVELDFVEDEDEEEEEEEEEEEGAREGKTETEQRRDTKTGEAAGAGAEVGADGQASPQEEQEKKVPYDPVQHLLRLMATRIHQEYFEQLNSMHRNVFRAIEKVEDSVAGELVDALSPEEQERLLEKDRVKGELMEELSMLDWEEEVEERVHKSNPRGHPVKMVFRQWVQELVPSPPHWRNWVSPNGTLVIEKFPCILKKNLPVMLKQFKKPCDIPYGTRLCVIDNNADDSGLDLAFTEDDRSGKKYWMQARKWLFPNPLYPDGVEGPKDENGNFEMVPVIRDDRRIAFIAPTQKYGTDKKAIFHVPEDDGPHAHIFTVDSLFRSNQTDKQAKLQAVEAEAAAESKNQPKATTKKAKERQMEQERLRAEAKKRKLEEVFSSFAPDGFLLMEGRCSTDKTKDKTLAVASLKGHPMLGIANMGTPAENEIYQDESVERPSPYDYVYLPEWVLKYFPSQDGVFAQDEVLLWMRQNEKTARILRILEGDRLVGKVIELYERSRLSELSRPPDLREVDMDVPGVTEAFVKDLIEKIWQDVVPGEVKPFLVPVDDDFMRSFILSRAIPDPVAQLSNGEAFAKAVQYALVLAVSMKISLSMQEDPRYKYIMEQPDKSQAAAEYQAGKDAARWKAHERAKIEFGDKYDFDTVETLYAEEAAKALEKEGYESDLEDLEREERYLEEEADRVEELEEMKERMLDLDEAEAEAREEAETLLDEGGSEEEEEEEEEEGGGLVDEEEQEEMRKRKEEKAKAKEKAQGRVGGKSKEQEKAERAAKITILTIDSIKPGIDAALEQLFDDAVDEIAAAKLREIEKEESLANLRELTDEERTDTLKKHHDRIEKAKIANRRGFGHRLIHLA